MKTEQEIRDQIQAQQQQIARLQLEIKTAEGVIGGLLFVLGELTAPIPDDPKPTIRERYEADEKEY